MKNPRNHFDQWAMWMHNSHSFCLPVHLSTEKIAKTSYLVPQTLLYSFCQTFSVAWDRNLHPFFASHFRRLFQRHFCSIPTATNGRKDADTDDFVVWNWGCCHQCRRTSCRWWRVLCCNELHVTILPGATWMERSEADEWWELPVPLCWHKNSPKWCNGWRRDTGSFSFYRY